MDYLSIDGLSLLLRNKMLFPSFQEIFNCIIFVYTMLAYVSCRICFASICWQGWTLEDDGYYRMVLYRASKLTTWFIVLFSSDSFKFLKKIRRFCWIFYIIIMNNIYVRLLFDHSGLNKRQCKDSFRKK